MVGLQSPAPRAGGNRDIECNEQQLDITEADDFQHPDAVVAADRCSRPASHPSTRRANQSEAAMTCVSPEALSAGKSLKGRIHSKNRRRIEFGRVNRAALAVLPLLLARWLPSGRREGPEYVALNPTRDDCHLGSFRINLRTGRWADFATGDRGGDPISLAAYLSNLKQCEAAEKLAGMFGVEAG